MLKLLTDSSHFFLSPLCIVQFHSSTKKMHGQRIFCLLWYAECSEQLFTKYWLSIASRYETWQGFRFYHQHLVRKLWKSEQKHLFDAPCGVNCFALCVNVVNNRRPPENLGFSTWLKIFTTKSEQKSDVKMNNLHCKWGKVIGAFYLKLNLLLSAPTVLSVFKPSKGPFTHFNGEFSFE